MTILSGFFGFVLALNVLLVVKVFTLPTPKTYWEVMLGDISKLPARGYNTVLVPNNIYNQITVYGESQKKDDKIDALNYSILGLEVKMSPYLPPDKIVFGDF